MKIYLGKISYLSPILCIPIIITIGVLFEGDFKHQPLIVFLFLLWIPFLILILFPLAYKLRVDNGVITNSLFGMIIMNISIKDIESINYGGISLWNNVYPSRAIIYGKGLAILVYINGVRKTYGLSEKLYGKEAIETIRGSLGK